jgi:hypothetical protein
MRRRRAAPSDGRGHRRAGLLLQFSTGWAMGIPRYSMRGCGMLLPHRISSHGHIARGVLLSGS